MSRLDEILETVGARHGVSPDELARKRSRDPVLIHARVEVIMRAQAELGMSRSEIARELRVNRSRLTSAERRDEAALGKEPGYVGYDQKGEPVWPT